MFLPVNRKRHIINGMILTHTHKRHSEQVCISTHESGSKREGTSIGL